MGKADFFLLSWAKARESPVYSFRCRDIAGAVIAPEDPCVVIVTTVGNQTVKFKLGLKERAEDFRVLISNGFVLPGSLSFDVSHLVFLQDRAQ